MKKNATVRTVSLCLLMALLTVTLTSCSEKLSGTYTSLDLVSQSFTFKDDLVTISAFGINATGTYAIEGDEIAITYTLLGVETTWRQSFSKSGDSIYINGMRFIKQ